MTPPPPLLLHSLRPSLIQRKIVTVNTVTVTVILTVMATVTVMVTVTVTVTGAM